MNTKHTPGPWIIGTPPPNGEQTIGTGSAGGVMVAVATTGVDMEAITLANAHLIAAAPDMLAVLDELAESAEYWSDYDVPISIVDRINAARAKARGQDNAARAKARGQEYTPPDKADAMLAVRTGHKPIDIDDMLAVCIPGGSSCDPQDVADSIREYWRANGGGGMSTQIKAMSIQPIYRDLWPELAKAACAMVHAHMDNERMVPALDDVAEQFPDLTRDQLTCLWMGVNAKDREGLVGA